MATEEHHGQDHNEREHQAELHRGLSSLATQGRLKPVTVLCATELTRPAASGSRLAKFSARRRALPPSSGTFPLASDTGTRAPLDRAARCQGKAIPLERDHAGHRGQRGDRERIDTSGRFHGQGTSQI